MLSFHLRLQLRWPFSLLYISQTQEIVILSGASRSFIARGSRRTCGLLVVPILPPYFWLIRSSLTSFYLSIHPNNLNRASLLPF